MVFFYSRGKDSASLHLVYLRSSQEIEKTKPGEREGLGEGGRRVE